MAKVGHAVGLSYLELGGGKYRLFWRQWEQREDGSRHRPQRTVTCYSVDERKRLELEIEASLRDKGWWAPTSEAPAKPPEGNLEAVAVEWIQWKVGVRGASRNTRTNLAGSIQRFFRAVRTLLRIREDEVVRTTVLNLELTSRVIERWRQEGYATGTIYQTAVALYDMWSWASDVQRWPLLPPAPRNAALVLPRQQDYVTPNVEPTLAECDAMIRRLAFPGPDRKHEPVPFRLATIMRYTGLRLEQAIHIHREDLDLAARTLVVRKGKSAHEKALHRTVPVSPWLIEDLRSWFETAPAGPLFPDTKPDAEGRPQPMVSYRNTSRYPAWAWREAICAGEAREGVLIPDNREKNRPNHALRAAFQAHMEAEGISDRVIDWLVGHKPRDTRGKSYVSPGWDKLVVAVGSVPRIDFGEGLVSPDR